MSVSQVPYVISKDHSWSITHSDQSFEEEDAMDGDVARVRLRDSVRARQV
jgi:hypothetical protein